MARKKPAQLDREIKAALTKPKVGETITYKVARMTFSGRVVHVGESTVDIAVPGPARGGATRGTIQFAGGVTKIMKSDIVPKGTR